MKFQQLTRIILVIAVLGYSLLITPLSPSAAARGQAGTTLSVTPAAADVILNNTTTVSLYVTDAVKLNAIDITVTYDPTKVRLASWAHGGFLSNLWTFKSVSDTDHGTLWVVATQLSTPGVTGSGNLINLTFSSIAYGVSPVTIMIAHFASSDVPPVQTDPILQSGTLAVHGNPALPYTVTGTFKMQGRLNTDGIPVSLSKINWFGPYNATTTNQSTNNLTINSVYGDIYRITTNQPRYLNVTSDLNKTKTITASTTLSTLLLWGGNAVWTDNIIDANDLALVAGAFGQSGPSLAADVNFSGKVDLFDLTLVAGNYGLTSAVAYQSWMP